KALRWLIIKTKAAPHIATTSNPKYRSVKHMIQSDIAFRARAILESADNLTGIAMGRSWLQHTMDEFSERDLILVTNQKVSGDKDRMISYAKILGNFLSAFTGEHVSEPRVLICLYDNPLLHVDIKFLTPDEFSSRVETPVLLLDKHGDLEKALQS